MSYPVHPLRERLAPYVLGVGGLLELLTPLPGLLFAAAYFLYLLWRKRQELQQRQALVHNTHQQPVAPRPSFSLPQLHTVWEWIKERWQSLSAVAGISQGLASWLGYAAMVLLVALAVVWAREWLLGRIT